MRVTIATVVLSLTAAVGGTPTAIERVAWLQGCWGLTSAGRIVEEQWTAPRGGSMLGTVRTVQDGRLLSYEFVIIRERADELVYAAHPSGQPSAEFVSTSSDTNSIVFENAEHDFPQRIGYRRRGAALDAWIEGATAGRSRRIEFSYERRACPADHSELASREMKR